MITPSPPNFQFRYATWIDLILILIASIAAIATGASFPLLWLFLGEFVNTFASQTVTTTLISNLTETFLMNVTDVSCSTPFNFDPNTSNTTVADFVSFSTSMQFSCISDADFFSSVDNVAFAFVGIGLVAFLVSYIQISFIQTAAERQVYKIRLAYYRAVLRQDIAWFDANPTGEISTRLSE